MRTIDDILVRPDFFSEPAPSAANAFTDAQSPKVLGTSEIAAQILNLGRGTRQITVKPGDDIQMALDFLHVLGGGLLSLGGGTHYLSSNLTGYSNIAILGDGVSSTIDWNGGAYQFQLVGSNAYSTGTVAVANGATSVVGTGTTFTAAMVGRSILLQDLWYQITARTDNTHITIGSAYAGTALSGASYVIATINSAFSISGVTLQNSTVQPIKLRYFDDVVLSDVIFADSAGGLDADDGSGLQVLGGFSTDLSALAYDLTNCQFGTFFNNTAVRISAGGAFSMSSCRNWTVASLSWESVVGNAMTLTSTLDISVSDFSIQNITGKGIEFVSGNSNISVQSGAVDTCSSDGIKLTATTDNVQIATLNITNNGGYGINIADSTDDNNIISMNYLASNSSGNLNDAGTNTVIGPNAGI